MCVCDSDAAVVTFTFTLAWSLVTLCVFHRSEIYYLMKVGLLTHENEVNGFYLL